MEKLEKDKVWWKWFFNLPDLEKDPVCNGFMNKNDFEQYRERMLSFLRKHPEDYYRIMEEVIVV
jgi:uncharacterized protein